MTGQGAGGLGVSGRVARAAPIWFLYQLILALLFHRYLPSYAVTGTKHLGTATRVMIRLLHRYLTRENLPRSYGKIASFFQVTEREVGTAVTAETVRSVRPSRPAKVTPDLQGRIVAFVTESAENRRKTYAEVSFLPQYLATCVDALPAAFIEIHCLLIRSERCSTSPSRVSTERLRPLVSSAAMLP